MYNRNAEATIALSLLQGHESLKSRLPQIEEERKVTLTQHLPFEHRQPGSRLQDGQRCSSHEIGKG